MPNTKPFVGVAAFCEKLLLEPDGVPTAVRIVDTYFVTVPKDMPPDTLPGIEVQGLISLRSGDVVGNHTISLIMENPLGERKALSPEGGWPVVFNGGEHGVNVRLSFTLGVKNFGLCWFDVLFESELLTRIPLMLREGEKPKPSGVQGLS